MTQATRKLVSMPITGDVVRSYGLFGGCACSFTAAIGGSASVILAVEEVFEHLGAGGEGAQDGADGEGSRWIGQGGGAGDTAGSKQRMKRAGVAERKVNRRSSSGSVQGLKEATASAAS